MRARRDATRTLCRVQLQQLAYFVAVAEVRHFTQAAEILRVAQPSLSKQIRALESELSVSLFSRARGNITLTPAGEALLPLAKRILADVETARLEVQELAGLKRGRVRLGATPSLCAGLLADVLRRFHDAYPGIQLLVEEGGSRDLVRELTRGSWTWPWSSSRSRATRPWTPPPSCASSWWWRPRPVPRRDCPSAP